MQAYFSLSAQSSPHQISRYYRLLLTRDLFGYLLLTTYHGCIGQKGRYRFEVANPNIDENVDIRRRLRVKLAKRLYSARRIGCNYTMNRYSGDQEFEDTILQGQLKELVERQSHTEEEYQ